MANKCSNCKIDIEEKVDKYSISNYGKSLCRDCQKKEVELKVDIETKPVLVVKKDSFDYNMIKGRIAESLIEQLFITMKYRVYRYGMENTIPGIMELLGKVRTDVSNVIKRMPDFVIQDNNGEAHFIEVKFRSNELFSIKDLKENKYGEYPFENAFFIVVSKDHIKCLSYTDLKAGKEITPASHNYLGNIKAFDTDKEIIKEYCKYAVKFFENV